MGPWRRELRAGRDLEASEGGQATPASSPQDTGTAAKGSGDSGRVGMDPKETVTVRDTGDPPLPAAVGPLSKGGRQALGSVCCD